jgi:hypothetical protein
MIHFPPGAKTRTIGLSSALLVATLCALPARAADCTEEGRKQVGDLAAFAKMAGIDHCASAEGRALYERDAALQRVLVERDRLLAAICPDSDARWEYARKTLRTLSHVFASVSSGCGG